MADLKFYEVDASYINYLLQVDSRVPHVDYSASSPHDKFLCGIVLTVNNHDYFAPITSFKKPQRTNVLIRNPQGRVLSSIRLSFMIPIPPGAVFLKDIDSEPSQNYRFLLYNELRFCNKNADYIRQRAKIVYDAVTVKKIPLMLQNCCDFKKLEAACAEYSKNDMATDKSIDEPKSASNETKKGEGRPKTSLLGKLAEAKEEADVYNTDRKKPSCNKNDPSL